MALGINTNLSALSGMKYLNQSKNNMNSVLNKLSSGLKINKASDSPAGLVISELLRGQIGGLNRAMQNTQEANNVLSIAEGGLQQMSDQLRSMRELALHALNSGVTGKDQVSADQAQLNGTLGSISNIAASTRYSSKQLLDGSQAVSFGVTDAAGLIDASGTTIESYMPDALSSASVTFSGNAADQAEKASVESNFGGGTTLAADQEFTVTGNSGSASISAAAGTPLADLAEAINAKTGTTGVTAYAIQGGTELRLVSDEYGSDQKVQVNQTTGSGFAAEGGAVRDEGQDATVTVGGQSVRANGLTAGVADGSFTGTVQLTEAAAQTGYDQDTLANASAASASIGQIQGGMRFQLGETSGVQSRDAFGIGSFSLANLGKTTVDDQSYSLADLMSGGAASLAKDPAAALKVIDQAISDVSSQRASIGAYQSNTLQANANTLSVGIENITGTESYIRDADMAAEVSNLVKFQLLTKTGLMAIQSANTSARNVIGLLGG